MICYCFSLARSQDEDACRQFRLELKARLNYEHREELAVCNHDINDRKRRLQELYENVDAEYQKLIDKFL